MRRHPDPYPHAGAHALVWTCFLGAVVVLSIFALAGCGVPPKAAEQAGVESIIHHRVLDTWTELTPPQRHQAYEASTVAWDEQNLSLNGEASD